MSSLLVSLVLGHPVYDIRTHVDPTAVRRGLQGVDKKFSSTCLTFRSSPRVIPRRLSTAWKRAIPCRGPFPHGGEGVVDGLGQIKVCR
jgi:hypothetical protein